VHFCTFCVGLTLAEMLWALSEGSFEGSLHPNKITAFLLNITCLLRNLQEESKSAAKHLLLSARISSTGRGRLTEASPPSPSTQKYADSSHKSYQSHHAARKHHCSLHPARSLQEEPQRLRPSTQGSRTQVASTQRQHCRTLKVARIL
jgi:hypothetical protein